MQELCSALLLKVSETMPPGEPGGLSPPVTLGGIIRTNVFLKIMIVKHREISKEIQTKNMLGKVMMIKVKIGNTSICKKVTKPDKESLLAIN
ncbi:unnamed protein product [Rhizophagus irregularis]|nr:unnamed protein product [Rhizophagus irregularis]